MNSLVIQIEKTLYDKSLILYNSSDKIVPNSEGSNLTLENHEKKCKIVLEETLRTPIWVRSKQQERLMIDQFYKK